MTEKLSVTIQKRTNEQYTPPTQSANTLFRFFKKPDYLFDSIKKKALTPRYYGENVDYLDIGHHQVAYPMICFCDITIHRLAEHMHTYGEYGIAFSKEWGISRGIQPLQYINHHSILKEDFSRAFALAMKTESDSPIADFLLTKMYYMKPIEGTMPRDGVDVKKNFTDECEWRYIPDVAAIDLPQAVIEDDAASIEKLNATIADNETCWLKFDFSDIKHIIIPTEDDFEALCSIINNVDGQDERIKNKLISKIILWSDAKEDF